MMHSATSLKHHINKGCNEEDVQGKKQVADIQSEYGRWSIQIGDTYYSPLDDFKSKKAI